MMLLIVGADRPLGRLLADRLARDHELRLVAAPCVETPESGCSVVDTRDPDSVAPLAAGIDAILHLGAYDPLPLGGPDSEQETLDFAGRGTYVLLREAVRAGVERVVLVSRLSVMDGYPADHVIDEMWKPRPSASAEALAPHMAEIVCREYAREGPLRCVCLRFGELGAPEGTSEADAVRAVEASLALPFQDPGYRWHVCHVSSSARFPLRAAAQLLGLSREEPG